MSCELNEKVYLKSTYNGTSDLIVERFLLWKKESDKNDTRANALIYRALFVTTFVFVFAILLSWIFSFIFKWLAPNLTWIGTPENGKFNLGFIYVGFLSVAYWKMTGVYRAQWQYCASLYNDILKATNPQQARAMRNALAMDLIVTDMWSHRSFRELFSSELQSALKHNHEFEPALLKDKKEKIDKNEFSELDATNELLRYQSKLLDELNAYIGSPKNSISAPQNSNVTNSPRTGNGNP